MKRLLVLWCALACILCGALAYYAFSQRQKISALREPYATNHKIAQAEIADLLRRISATEAERKTAEQQLPGKRLKKPTELSDKERFDRMIVKMDTKNENSILQGHDRAITRRHHQEEYGDLYEELNLPLESLERFKQLLVEKYEASSDAAAIIASRGVSSFSQVGQNAREQAEQMVERDIAELLGTEKYSAYKEYNRVYRDTIRLDEFQSWLAEKNIVALDKAQVRALATACCDVNDKARNPDYATIADNNWGPVATQQILQPAEMKLTSEQAKAFREYRAARNAAEKATDDFIRGEAPLPKPLSSTQ